jgi:K+-sensing histidine kinase KdpD
MNTKISFALHSSLGVALSALCAVTVALVFSRTPWKMVAPFFFAVILVLLAGRFGAIISVVGSLLASIIFSSLLFSPLHSFYVQDTAERAALAWMILLSVAASYLLFPSHSGRTGL